MSEYPSYYSRENDARRQAEIYAMPASVLIEFLGDEHEVIEVPVRAEAQAKDDAWRAFRDSAGGQSLIHAIGTMQDEPGETC